MNREEFDKFIEHLKESHYRVFSVMEKDGSLSVGEPDESEDVIMDSRLPLYGWKKVFLPKKEIFNQEPDEKIVAVGMSAVDLKAVLLYDHVFENDIYYQKRRANTLVIGYGLKENALDDKYEEDTLEHLRFDIFLVGKKSGEFQVFGGSEKGAAILEAFGCSDFRHIEFAGTVKEGELNKIMNEIRDRLRNNYDRDIWEEDLGKRCIACGRCSIVCPMCFCFRLDEQANGEKTRGWDSCFYRDFSEVAGGHKFLKTPAQRIFFWYYHKFVRIPDEFDFMGCVNCGRCTEVCPVEIDIREVLRKIISDKQGTENGG